MNSWLLTTACANAGQLISIVASISACEKAAMASEIRVAWESEFNRIPAGRVDTRIGPVARNHDPFDPVLAEQEFKIGVGKTTRCPVLLGDHVPRLRRDLIDHLNAEAAVGKRTRPLDPQMPRRGMLPAVVFAPRLL